MTKRRLSEAPLLGSGMRSCGPNNDSITSSRPWRHVMRSYALMVSFAQHAGIRARQQGPCAASSASLELLSFSFFLLPLAVGGDWALLGHLGSDASFPLPSSPRVFTAIPATTTGNSSIIMVIVVAEQLSSLFKASTTESYLCFFVATRARQESDANEIGRRRRGQTETLSKSILLTEGWIYDINRAWNQMQVIMNVDNDQISTLLQWARNTPDTIYARTKWHSL